MSVTRTRVASGGGPSVPYTTVLNLDFAALPPDDWSSNTAGADVVKTLDGVSVTTNRGASLTAWGVVGGSGLVATGNDTGTILIPNATLGYTVGLHRLVMQLSFTTASISTAVVPVLMELYESGDDRMGPSLRYTGSEYGLAAQTKRGVTTTIHGPYLEQASAPASMRLEGDILGPALLVRGDLEAGTALPDPGTMTPHVSCSRIDRGVDDPLLAPSILLTMRPGDVSGTITLKRLRVLRYAL